MADSNRPMTLKFSLEETVWFRKGDEIGELINLSLEPNVTIHDLDHFVSIQGSLEMNGEFKRVDERDEQEESLSFTGQKFATVLETRELGICEFSYDFPVDITIPKTRVKDPNELDLVIDMFDYRIPEKNALQVSTDILITGVYNEIPDDGKEDSEEREPEKEWSDDFGDNEYYYINPNSNNPLYPFQDLEERERDGQEAEFTVEAKKPEQPAEEKDDRQQIPIQIFHNPEEDFEEVNSKLGNEGEEIPGKEGRKDTKLSPESEMDGQTDVKSSPESGKDSEPDRTFDFIKKTDSEENLSLERDGADESPDKKSLEKESPFETTETWDGRTDHEKDIVKEKDKTINSHHGNRPHPEIPIEGKGEKGDGHIADSVNEKKGKDHSYVEGDMEQFWEEEAVRDKEDKLKQTTFEGDQLVAGYRKRQEDEPETVGDMRQIEEPYSEEPPSEDPTQDVDRKQDGSRTEKNIHYQSKATEEGEERPISLTEYFARKEEPKSVRMTVYIVQAEDSLGTIAEKYDVQVSQILRMNRLEAQHDVYEGQVLYIPKRVKHSSSAES